MSTQNFHIIRSGYRIHDMLQDIYATQTKIYPCASLLGMCMCGFYDGHRTVLLYCKNTANF